MTFFTGLLGRHVHHNGGLQLLRLGVLRVMILGPAASLQAASIRVLPLGNSLTAGGKASHNSGYWQRLWNLIEAGLLAGTIDMVGSSQSGPNDIDRYHEGNSGNTVSETIVNPGDGTTIEGWLNDALPDVILLHIGTVDAAQNRSSNPPVNALADLDDLVDSIYQTLPNVSVAIATIIGTSDPSGSEYAQYIDDFNAGVPCVVATNQGLGRDVRLVDMFNDAGLIYGPGTPDFQDPIHPTDGGFDRMGDLWYLELLDIVPEPSGLALLAPGVLLNLRRKP